MVKAEGKRYGDPELKAATLAGKVDASAISRFRDLVHECSNDEQLFTEFLGGFLSRYRLAHDRELTADVLRVFVRAVFGSLLFRAI